MISSSLDTETSEDPMGAISAGGKLWTASMGTKTCAGVPSGQKRLEGTGWTPDKIRFRRQMLPLGIVPSIRVTSVLSIDLQGLKSKEWLLGEAAKQPHLVQTRKPR